MGRQRNICGLVVNLGEVAKWPPNQGRAEMEIDVTYLAALIYECDDPIAVLTRSDLPGDRGTEDTARATLIKHFGHSMVYRPKTHTSHMVAMRCLGVDVPEEEEVSVVTFKRVRSPLSN